MAASAPSRTRPISEAARGHAGQTETTTLPLEDPIADREGIDPVADLVDHAGEVVPEAGGAVTPKYPATSGEAATFQSTGLSPAARTRTRTSPGSAGSPPR